MGIADLAYLYLALYLRDVMQNIFWSMSKKGNCDRNVVVLSIRLTLVQGQRARCQTISNHMQSIDVLATAYYLTTIALRFNSTEFRVCMWSSESSAQMAYLTQFPSQYESF